MKSTEIILGFTKSTCILLKRDTDSQTPLRRAAKAGLSDISHRASPLEVLRMHMENSAGNTRLKTVNLVEINERFRSYTQCHNFQFQEISLPGAD